MPLLAWLVFPLLALGVCLGIGLLCERIVRAELPLGLLAALGYGAAIVVLGPIAALGSRGWMDALALVLLALAGWLLALRARRVPGRIGGAAIAGIAVYALYIAPIALSGKVTFLGYNLLNDTAIHLALVDWIGDHGSRFAHQIPSSYGAAINDYVGARYPLGSHELLAALKPLVALDASKIYQPFLAFSAAVAAGGIHALGRRAGLSSGAAAAAAIAALASQLVFSFALQGGIKELSFIVCLTAAAGLAASGDVRLMALPAAALYAIYGIYGMPWIAALAVTALWLARPTLRAAVQAVLVFLVAIVVLVPDSIHYYNHGHDVITSGSELGPLAGPLNPLQTSGVWLNGDYRFAPQHSAITYALAVLLLLAAGWGAIAALRGRGRAVLLLLIPALAALLITAPASSPYIDAKLFAITSPALILTAALGLTAVRWLRGAVAIAAVLALALLVSDALAYRDALVAPSGRLGELAAIDRQFAGRGPILVNEYEEYTKHFMRRSRGSDPYEGWNAGRAQLRDPSLPVAGHAYDLDQLRTSFVERYPLIALRRSPTESYPPSNYRRVWAGRFYEVWQRTGPAPRAHIPLHGALPCRLARGNAVALIRPQPALAALDAIPSLPPGWYRDAQHPGAVTTNKGGRIDIPIRTGGGAMHVWLQGSAFRDLQVLVDGRSLGTVRALNGPNQWMDVGPAQLSAGEHRVTIIRPTRSLRPGDAQHDVIGPLAIVSTKPPFAATGPNLRRFCGQTADWIDILRR